MSRLDPLRSRLATLRRRRRLARWAVAYGTLVAACAAILLAACVVDRTFRMSRPQRIVSLLCCAAGAVWVWRRSVRPHLGQSEDLEETALIVERNHRIDSDLVAALQFESSGASSWGSPRLQQEVVERVGRVGGTLDVFAGMSFRTAAARLAWGAAGLLVLGGLAAAYPAHAVAFANRFLLGDRHYPTRTHVAAMRIDDRTVFAAPAGEAVRISAVWPGNDDPVSDDDLPGRPAARTARRLPILAAFGRPVRFAVDVAGDVPEKVTIALVGRTHDVRTELELLPEGAATGAAPESAADAAHEATSETKPKSGTTTFVGTLSRLVDSVEWHATAGDAWTDPARIDVIPLPVVTIDLVPHLPQYASHLAVLEGPPSPGSRQLVVLDGTRIDLAVRCTNKKLKRIDCVLDERPFALGPDAEGVWRPTQVADSPLQPVTKSLRYAIQVEDEDGLKLERPLEGAIGLKADKEPRITARMVRTAWLPTAMPEIRFGATDDFGVAAVVLQVQVRRADGTTEEETLPVRQVPQAQQPLTNLLDTYVLDLRRWNLQRGEELKVVPEVVDYRGGLPARTGRGESLAIQITDRAGVAAALLESDQKSAQQLDAIILRELGIGDAP